MNLSGIVLSEDQSGALERWTGGEVMLSLRAQFRAVKILQEQALVSDEALQDTHTLLKRFIAQFPASTGDAITYPVRAASPLLDASGARRPRNDHINRSV